MEPFLRELSNLEKLASRFGTQMLGAFRSAAMGGRQFEDVLRSIGLNLAGMALDHGLKPLAGLAGPVLPGLLKSVVGMIPFAQGGVPGRVTPFAGGGVVSGPTLFPMGRSLGLMGEAGAEAILPLRRGPDGALGVAAAGSGGGVNVVFNVTTTDAASFRKSEAQVTGMLARAVMRGGRRL
ncbi:MAG: phage tail tape measure protein [Rhizobiaceae bacterium]